MTALQMTIADLVDQAIEGMNLRRMQKLALKAKMKFPRLANEVYTQIAAEMCDQPECDEVMLTTINAEDFQHTQTMLAINPDNLKALLDFVAKILPGILALFFKV